MRGFAQALSVPFLFDVLRYPGLAMSPRGTFVYDHIEVIKGPASVLHGLGTVTGAVNFVAKSVDGLPRRELFVSTDRWQAHNLGLDLGGTLQKASSSQTRRFCTRMASVETKLNTRANSLILKLPSLRSLKSISPPNAF